MADVQAILCGLESGPIDLNPKTFRDEVRQQILALPQSKPLWPPTIELIEPALLGSLREHAARVAGCFPVNFERYGLDPVDLAPSDNMDIIEIVDD